jgi:hypothetical protein
VPVAKKAAPTRARNMAAKTPARRTTAARAPARGTSRNR